MLHKAKYTYAHRKHIGQCYVQLYTNDITNFYLRSMNVNRPSMCMRT